MTSWLFVLQRATAVIMAPLVLIHLIVILYASQGGLSAAEILSRTQTSLFWPFFYALFVTTAAIHGAIGLRAIAIELSDMSKRVIDVGAAAFALLILILGFRAIGAVT